MEIHVSSAKANVHATMVVYVKKFIRLCVEEMEKPTTTDVMPDARGRGSDAGESAPVAERVPFGLNSKLDNLCRKSRTPNLSRKNNIRS